MFKIIRAGVLLFALFTNSISISSGFYDKAIKEFKDICKKVFPEESNRKIKFELDDMSGTIPYKLYLIIQELQHHQNSNLFLNRLLLYGPPGNGKSTYARKIAEIINASYREISGPSIVNTYQGSGADNINKIFCEAISENDIMQRNVVIFIDEVDSIASKNTKRVDNKAAVQALWLNLDKIKNNPSIFVIIATNEFKKLHPTLLDRFGDNIIEIQNPDVQMRKEVIDFFAQKFQLNPDKIKINDLVKKMNGFSIRAIEDALRSIKRIANIENNGEPNDQIINDVLSTHNKKPLFEDLESKLEKPQKYLNFINSAGGVISLAANSIMLYRYIKENRTNHKVVLPGI